MNSLASSIGCSQELKDSKGKPLQIGLQLYSVRDDCARDLPGTLKAVARMGYKGVEFAGYYNRSAAELHKMLDEDGLKCYGTHVDLDAISGDNLDKTLAYAHELGCGFVVVPWLPENRRNSMQTAIDSAKLFTEAARMAAARGIKIGWHNEDYEFHKFDGETIWQIFWSHAGKQVAMEFDTGNALSAGEQAAPYLLKYPEKVYAVHVKDHSSTNPKALLGEGDEHWSEVIPILKKKTATKLFIIEQESYGEPPLICVEKCLANFKKLWQEY
jgi:sugar phosphate isomerase/epimerase